MKYIKKLLLLGILALSILPALGIESPECGICFTDIKSVDGQSDGIMMGCCHAQYCTTCIKETVRTAAQDYRAASFDCPNPDCKIPVSIKRFINLIHFGIEEIHEEDAEGVRLQKEKDIDLRARILELLAIKEKALANNARVKKTFEDGSKACPRCEAPIFRFMGCKRMTCSFCQHQFCWVCLEDWNIPPCNCILGLQEQFLPRAMNENYYLNRYGYKIKAAFFGGLLGLVCYRLYLLNKKGAVIDEIDA